MINKYNGKEFDARNRLDLYDYSARYYESAIGRFTTVDPLAEIYYSWSPYAYVKNNPMRFIDPTGMYSTDEWKKDNNIQESDLITIYKAPDENSNQDWPPFGNTDHTLVGAEQQALEKYKTENYFSKAVSTSQRLISEGAKSLLRQKMNGVVAIGVDLTYEAHAIVSVSSKIVGAVYITKGKDKGKLVILAEGGIGGAVLAGISISGNGTQYRYDGDLNNFGVDSLLGEGLNVSLSAGEIFVVNASISHSKDKFGGRVFGYTVGGGVGVSATAVDASFHATFTAGKIINK